MTESKLRLTKKTNETIVLDEGIFRNVEFKKCYMIYRGGTPPLVKNVTWQDNDYQFEGAAHNTIQFLKTLFKKNKDIKDEDIIRYFRGTSTEGNKNENA